MPASQRLSALSLPTVLSILCHPGAAQGTNVDWTPIGPEVVLNTDVGRVLTNSGWFTVRGGVYVFRNVTIPRGVTVRGEGTNPLIFVIAGKITILGSIRVDGEDGQRVDTRLSANIPSLGGRGQCGGGDGGLGSPYRNQRSTVGGWGSGPLNTAGLGGGGGRLSCTTSCAIGSGGGGGSFATAGDPWYKAGATSYFVQPTGHGAFGCTNRILGVLPGGPPGSAYFRDNNPANDFLGVGVDVNRRILIQGELPQLVGGSGGGGGGDYSANRCMVPDRLNFRNDERGGGGGSGGGVFVVISDGDIEIGPEGVVSAEGGDGGGGAWAGSCNRAGGGGGGAGGFIALWTKATIDIATHGETYANNDYELAVSADGGVGLMATYGSAFGIIRSKYDPAPHQGNPQGLMNARPAGGFGGMGIIQFMTRPGNNTDGTNTILDDNIIIRDASTRLPLRGAAKQRYLAWRGVPDAAGIRRDDSGNPVDIGKKAGDFRPCPILLPVF